MANMENIEEWDYIDVLPQYEDPRPKIAGNYGPASNIWHIGMVSSHMPHDHQGYNTITENTNAVGSACTI